jgi:hypothetical protein
MADSHKDSDIVYSSCEGMQRLESFFDEKRHHYSAPSRRVAGHSKSRQRSAVLHADNDDGDHEHHDEEMAKKTQYALVQFF